MAEHERGQVMQAPAELIGLQTNSKLRVGTATVDNVKQALVGTQDEPGLIQVAAKMLVNGVFPPNPKSFLCGKKYCPAYEICRYHE
jgi:hypothetical protein